MGDFILDLRGRDVRWDDPSPLKYLDSIKVDRIERSSWTLLCSRVGPAELWAPHECETGAVVAIAGQMTLRESELKAAAQVPGKGGLVCKALLRQYQDKGPNGLRCIDGSCAVFIFDPVKARIQLFTDISGAFPCFGWEVATSAAVYSSHPDLLARAVGEERNWDYVSLAEFLTNGRVSAPYSYYQSVRGLEFGSLHSISVNSSTRTVHQIFDPTSFSLTNRFNAEEFANHLAKAIARAVRRAVSPRLGDTAIAISGGLDSRTILCCCAGGVLAICAIDEENQELQLARRIAESQGVRLIVLRRAFEHYGSWAELAVKMTGGMGDIGSNHFLGFHEDLKELGVENLVTGCYFDYLFKALALDTTESAISRREHFSDFSLAHYLPNFTYDTELARAVEHRLEEQFPASFRFDKSDLGRLRTAGMRTFPLFREGDNMQRVVTQKMISWYTPALDSEVIELHRHFPPRQKLNKRLFTRVVKILCGDDVCRIPDANTGLPIGASQFLVSLYRYRNAFRRRLQRLRPTIATQESWPNWRFYLERSEALRRVWKRRNDLADEIFYEITGEIQSKDIRPTSDRDCQSMLRKLTLKIWLDHREGVGAV